MRNAPFKDHEHKKKLAALITGMFTVYNRELTLMALDLYCRVLAEYPYEDVDRAVRTAIQTKQYCPKPIEIIELIGGTEEDRAEIEAAKVVNAISSIGSYASVIFDDPVTQAVIESYGGWPDVCEECANKESEKWFRLNFKKTYRAFARQGIKKFGYLPGLVELQNRVNGYDHLIGRPAIVGDAQKARLVLEQGKKETQEGPKAIEKIKELVLQ